MQREIAPRKTGLIVFASRIISVFTGMLFLIMVTRWLSPQQFGLWEVISTFVIFASYPSGLITYWATREIARGKLVAKTALFMNLIMCSIGLFIFTLFSISSYSVLHTYLYPFLLAIILIPASYFNNAVNSIIQGYDPSIIGYSLIVSEICKLASAYPLLFILKLNISAVIISVSLSYFIQAMIGAIMVRSLFKGSIDISSGKRWLKDSWLPGLNTLNYTLLTADTFIASLIYQDTSIAGYYQAAFIIASVVSYALYLSFALYPLLLRGSSDIIVGKVIDFSLLFAIPMATGSIALAQKILFLLSPSYTRSTFTLILLSFGAIATLFSFIFDQILSGRERADLAESDRFLRLLKSDLSFVQFANLVYSVIYILSVLLIIEYSHRIGIEASEAAGLWALSQLITTSLLSIVKGMRVKSKVSIKLDGSIHLYIISSIIMGFITYYLGSTLLSEGLDALHYGLRLIIIVLSGIFIYFSILLGLDKKSRDNLSSFLKSLVKQQASL